MKLFKSTKFTSRDDTQKRKTIKAYIYIYISPNHKDEQDSKRGRIELRWYKITRKTETITNELMIATQ